MPVHAYTTAVVSDDGLFQAEILSLPNFVRAEVVPPMAVVDQVDEVARSLHAHIEIVGDFRGEAGLISALELMAVQTDQVRGARNMPQLAEAVVFEPVVVVEESPPTITSLAALIAQFPLGYTFLVEDKPLLALALDSALVIVWFASGPVVGLRRAVEEATYEVSKEFLVKALRGLLGLDRSRRDDDEQ